MGKLESQIAHYFEADDLSAEISDLLNHIKVKDSHSARIKEIFSALPAFLESIQAEYESLNKLIKVSSKTLEASARDILNSNNQLKQMNSTMQTMLDNLDEGILLFDKEGKCINECSKVTKDFLEIDPCGKKIPEILRIPHEDWESFMDWYNYLLDPNLDFHEMASLGPATLPHTIYNLNVKYRPIKVEVNGESQPTGVIVLITDTTAELEASARVQKILNYSEMVMNFYNDRDTFFKFLDLYRQNVETLSQFVEQKKVPDKNEVLRMLHTIKGCAGTLYIEDLKSKAHEIETTLISFWTADRSPSEILNEINCIREDLEMTLRIFSQQHSHLLGGNIQSMGSDSILVSKKSLNSFYNDLLNARLMDLKSKFVKELLTTPFIQLLAPLEQNALATARRLEKPINVFIEGNPNIRVLAEPYRNLLENLVHITNNSMDHGIEAQDVRLQAGKDPSGNIRVEFSENNSGFIPLLELKISDDGQGIDPKVIRNRMHQKFGIDVSLESDEQVIRHIFDMGFSTSNALTELSGRGIGMNAVLEAVQKLGGTITLQSRPGKGITFHITVPIILEYEAPNEPLKITA